MTITQEGQEIKPGDEWAGGGIRPFKNLGVGSVSVQNGRVKNLGEDGTTLDFNQPDNWEETVKNLAAESMKRIAIQREEIITAFLAKYGLQPDDCIQIVENTPTGCRWLVTKRPIEAPNWEI